MKKAESERKSIWLKVRISQREMTRLQARAGQFTNGNVSELVRHAIDHMRSIPKKK